MLPMVSRRWLGRDLFEALDSLEQDSVATHYPKLDVREDKDNIYVHADLPGFKKEDVKVRIKDNVLYISGERKTERKVDENNFYRFERFSGKFERSLYLPEEVAADKIKAEISNGVLELSIPKLEEKKEKEISIDIR